MKYKNWKVIQPKHHGFPSVQLGGPFPYPDKSGFHRPAITINESPRSLDREFQEIANLFAAAPEMLDVLKEWIALDESSAECSECQALNFQCDNHDSQREKISKMRDAAIAKAEGREG